VFSVSLAIAFTERRWIYLTNYLTSVRRTMRVPGSCPPGMRGHCLVGPSDV